MIFFLAIILVPIIIGLGLFFYNRHQFTVRELLVHVGIQIVIAGICTGVTYFSNLYDREIWNGQVTAKQRTVVSCEHTYCCMTCQSCSTDSKGNTSCTSYCCMYCTHHSFDVDWRVYSSINEQLNINRIDWQGLSEPPRWTQVVIGEPWASSHAYQNYIKAAPNTLFRRDGSYEQYAKSLPEYPGEVFDYYRANRVVSVGVPLPDMQTWNNDLSVINSRLGAKKQVNLVLVLVANAPPDYFAALEQKWLGGKKNDVIVVASVDPQTLEYKWVKVMAWTYNEMVKVRLRDDLMDTKVLDRVSVMNALQSDVDQFFQRKHMSDFKYLASTITPSTTAWIVSLLISFIVGIATAVYFVIADPFGGH